MDQTRRQILKLIASAPLTMTFGFAGEALMRFAKPSMKPFGVFDPADMPSIADQPTFELKDFPAPWTCIPIQFHLKVTEFNPEQQELRLMQGFVIRLGGDEIVAYNRRCPTGKGCVLNYRANPHNCGCHPEKDRCCDCAVEAANPILMCPRDGCAFDLAHNGRILQGPAPRPPRRLEVLRQGEKISVVKMEQWSVI